MPRRKKHYSADQLRPRPRDLFGQIPVTVTDCENWVRAVAPQFAHAEWRMQRYIRDYNVITKVRAAKINGSFFPLIESIKAPFDRCAKCGNS